MSDFAIGRREYGQSRRTGRRWYHCAVMDEVVPEEETFVPKWPHKFAGLRVCYKHADPLSFAEREMIAPFKPSSTENGP